MKFLDRYGTAFDRRLDTEAPSSVSAIPRSPARARRVRVTIPRATDTSGRRIHLAEWPMAQLECCRVVPNVSRKIN